MAMRFASMTCFISANNSLMKQASHPQMLDALSLATGLLAWDGSSMTRCPVSAIVLPTIPIFDQNLKALAGKLRVTALIAHVRGVPYSENVTVGEQNLHRVSLQGLRPGDGHNGQLAGFDRMRFALVEHNQPEMTHLIRGDTDSEWIYAVLLSQLEDPSGKLTRMRPSRRRTKPYRSYGRFDASTTLTLPRPPTSSSAMVNSVVAIRFAFDTAATT